MFRVEDYISLTSAIGIITKESDEVLFDELVTLRSRISDVIMKDFGENKRLMTYLEAKSDTKVDTPVESQIEQPLEEDVQS